MSVLVDEIITRIDQLNGQEVNELEERLNARATPGQEHLQLVRVVDETRWGGFATRLGRATRKTLVALIIIGAIVLATLLALYYWRTTTISKGNRQDGAQSAVGYRVEQYNYRDRARLIFEDGGDGQVKCDLAPMQISKLLEERWLASGRAVYLHLEMKSPEVVGGDGQPEAKGAKVLYDFQRGELYVTSQLHLWRTAASEGRWMTEEEFAGMLARFAQ